MKNKLIPLIACLILLGCSEEKPILGERIDINLPLEYSENVVSDYEGNTIGTYADTLKTNRIVEINIPEAKNVDSWTHVRGNVQHNSGNIQLSQNLRLLWQNSIGPGNTLKSRITTEPIIADGRIYTMSSSQLVRAFSLNGSLLWEKSLTKPGSDPSEASVGGLAFGEKLLFATTGFGELFALEPSTGFVVWSQEFSAPATSTPTVGNGKVFLITKDNKSWAIDIDNGRIDWGILSIDGLAVVSGNSSPAIANQNVIFGYPSGEIVSANLDSGSVQWRDFVGGSRGTGPISILTGITASPVVDGNRVYVSNQSGSTTAYDLSNGNQIWRSPEGSFGSVLAVDNSIFLISDASELVRLDASDGTKIWSVELPGYKKDNPRRQKAIFSSFGPLMVNGQLFVASGDGLIRFFDPVTSEITQTISVTGGATVPPIIVNNVLYIVNTGGFLLAFG